MSINSFSNELIYPDGQFKFLGTMAGDQVNKKNGHSTYSRQYKAFGGADELRNKIFKANGEEIKKIGDNYSFTPLRLRDGRNFGFLPTTWQGGGFFLTLKKLEAKDQRISSLEYVARILEPQLETISGFSVEELIKQFKAYGKDYMIKYFFEVIDLPKEGDLVIYERKDNFPPHYGIFRESKPNWNSAIGGTVESKWESWSNPYVFQHDVFCVPSNYDNVAKFYRLKNGKVNVDTLAIQPSAVRSVPPSFLNSNKMFNVQNDGSLTFNIIKENIERRQSVDKFEYNKLPEIECLDYIKFNGLCYDYAFGRVFSTYSRCSSIDMIHPQLNGEEILQKYFNVTTAPQKGDLVVYYQSETIKHWGIYLESDMVESKWGNEPVYRHQLFDVPNSYGDAIRCFQLKDGLTVKTLIANLKQDVINLKK